MPIFSPEQVEYMKSARLNSVLECIPDDELVKIEEVVAEALQKRGFDEDYRPTEEGRMCESILDALSEIAI